jgi:hypothetical protein
MMRQNDIVFIACYDAVSRDGLQAAGAALHRADTAGTNGTLPGFLTLYQCLLQHCCRLQKHKAQCHRNLLSNESESHVPQKYHPTKASRKTVVDKGDNPQQDLPKAMT